jgi:signal transduction histidine kinase
MSVLTTRDLAQDALLSLADGVTLVDETARVVLLNPRAQELLGMGPAEWTGAHAADFYRAVAVNSAVGDILAERLERQASRAAELPRLEFIQRLPKERMIEAKWFALHGTGAYGVIWRDVTQDKESEQIKNQLLSTVSHELRTPLASIKGFASTLLRQDVRWDEATQRDFLRIIEDESNRLEELIDNLLDMSQMEAGALRIQREPVQLRRLVREAVENAQRSTETHWFVMDLPAELPRVWADPRRIRQVLNNLLENSIKYAPDGGQITVTCEVVWQIDTEENRSSGALPTGEGEPGTNVQGEREQVIVSIADQGQGIPREYLDRIFDRFFQIDSASTRKTGGSGLGLSIAKGIIEAHGGRIWAESVPGQGSVFRFTLVIVKESDLLQNVE